MALKKCKECDYTVSTRADSCPSCGAPVKAKPRRLGCGALLIFLFALGMLGSLLDTDSTTTNSTKTIPPSKTIPSSPVIGGGGKTSPPSKPSGVVSNSAWDGSVWQVERYLEDNLKDPDSFEAIEWSEVIKVDVDTLPHKYIVRCKYRAKNSYGGYMIENQLFYLDGNGNVISTREFGS